MHRVVLLSRHPFQNVGIFSLNPCELSTYHVRLKQVVLFHRYEILAMGSTQWYINKDTSIIYMSSVQY